MLKLFSKNYKTYQTPHRLRNGNRTIVVDTTATIFLLFLSDFFRSPSSSLFVFLEVYKQNSFADISLFICIYGCQPSYVVQHQLPYSGIYALPPHSPPNPKYKLFASTLNNKD